MPTFLAAAGAAPDPAHPLDGMDLTAALTQSATPVARKLFWRYKNNEQQAMRDGDWKYLKIRDNTFLFNVADDPMERANYKERRKDIYMRMLTEYDVWNKTMLPFDPASFTGGPNGAQLADHFGVAAPAGQRGSE